jgi:hypothetical protein
MIIMVYVAVALMFLTFPGGRIDYGRGTGFTKKKSQMYIFRVFEFFVFGVFAGHFFYLCIECVSYMNCSL